MISHKHKFIFIHIPKTGGTSIEKLFVADAGENDVPHKHATLSQLEKNNLIPDDYYIFSIVRNPYSLTVSMYHYLWQSNIAHPKRWRHHHRDFAKLSFGEWVRHPYFKSPTIKSVNVTQDGGDYGSFIDWVSSKKFNSDFIGKCENLQEDFNIVCDKIGIPQQQLPHKNKSKHKHYTEYYDDETRKIVAEKYAKDIEYFGYEFGE